jgi:hypothetical protein
MMLRGAFISLAVNAAGCANPENKLATPRFPSAIRAALSAFMNGYE